MPSCIVPGCRNSTYIAGPATNEQDKYRKITFHSFPVNEFKRNIWLTMLGLSDSDILPRSAVCSVHFNGDDFICGPRKRTLKATAKPLLMLHNIEDEPMYEVSPTSQNTNFETSTPSTSRSPENICNESVINVTPTSRKRKSTCLVEKVDASTWFTPSRLHDTPIKRRIRESYKKQLSMLRQEMCAMRRKQKRDNITISTLRATLRTLKKKNLIAEEEFKAIENFSEFNKKLIHRQILKNCKLRTPRMWHAEIRRFALTLHYYSPRAYNYVRTKLNNCLPHEKHMSKWYRTLRCQPGISSQACNLIKRRVQKSKCKLLGTLMFDEMAIRPGQRIVGGKTYGRVDLGEGVEVKDALANEVLVFFVVCLNEKWKVPIAYYLTHGLSCEMKANLVTQCLIALEDINFRIVSVTCDGTAVNLSTFEFLGCNFNVNHLQTYFLHPVSKQKIYAFLDASHMLKLVRNTLGDCRIFDQDENEIKWSYIQELHHLQTEEKFHLANKLTVKHVNYKLNKMKVKLAAQLLSRSVADALTFCKNNLHLETFNDCSATIKFLKTFNDSFDILNSKSLKQYGFCKPIHAENYEEIRNKLNEAATYIAGLQLRVRGGRTVNIMKSPKKTGFLGFYINIKSLQNLYIEICEQKQKLLLYIPMYKLSQDHVEMYFSVIRSHSGCNDNPDVVQFESAFKKTLTHVELSIPSTGNCTPNDEIEILHVTSVQTPIEILNANASHWTQTVSSSDDHDYVDHITNTTAFSLHVIVYIAGFIVRKIQKRLKCFQCLQVLITSQKEEEYHALIRLKSRGFLIQPSADVVFICRTAEKAIRSKFTSKGDIIQQGLQKTLENDIILEFVDTNIFHESQNHTKDQQPLQNHRYFLIKLIVQTYIKTRMCHLLKISTMRPSERQFHKKLILFKGY